MKIYIGNLHLKASETELTKLFEAFGNVHSAGIIMDKKNGQSRGFGFVLMESQEGGMKAIHALNQLNYKNQYLEVSEAM
ncbi:RNA recognition motif domain-containing protein [Chitinophaga silvisoli]|uniref:RNA-binding protein n=1 Tax=Chitinophaga silvisoli TaxID=2291814 RepID=A0A3E1NXI0_9BACT|nr:RNA-binding protein [Chitinophaga silvisoli]RFM32564.1 RNA-binding protein [Chitinophaga silvisoli]